MTDFVYPYAAGLAEGRELELSIASVRTFYKGSARIWVIGDDPKLPGVNHLEAPRQLNKWIDVIYKMLACIDHPKIGESFVWMNDDMYFLKEFTFKDLAIPFSCGKLSEYDYTNSLAGDYYKKVMNQTMMECPPGALNFETHSPRIYNKPDMMLLIENFQLMTTPLNLASLYFNRYGYQFAALKAIDHKASIPYAIDSGFDKICQGKLWLNHTHGAYNAALEQYLISIINPNIMSNSKNAAANIWLQKVKDFGLYSVKKGLTSVQLEQRTDLYNEGVGIYTKLGKNRVLLSNFQRKENEIMRLKLQYELKKLKDPDYVPLIELKPTPSSGSDLNSSSDTQSDGLGEANNGSAPAAPSSASLRQNFRIDYTPEEMAHINYKDLPEGMKALFDENRELTKEIGQKHAEMSAMVENPENKEQRATLVNEIHAKDDRRVANWSRINAWFDGKPDPTPIPTKTVIKWTLKKIEALEDAGEKAIQKQNRIKSNKQYIKRNETNGKKKKEVELRIAELKQWNEWPAIK